MTETYVAMRSASTIGAGPACRSTCAPASRWRGARREIAIQFKGAPFALFRDTAVDTIAPNVLALQIQPDEGVRRCSSAPRNRARKSSWAACGWISAIATISSRAGDRLRDAGL
jgi:hypothetical protein